MAYKLDAMQETFSYFTFTSIVSF